MMPEIKLDRLRLQTGGQQNDAKNREIIDAKQVDVTIVHIPMMRIAENIHATHPQYATVAPISERTVPARIFGRSTTPNTTGAAA
jgi:hypothetical protein